MANDPLNDAYIPSSEDFDLLEHKGLLGATLLGTAAVGAKVMAPKGLKIGRHTANNAMNYLESFYQKGANKNLLYMNEMQKTFGRMAATMLNPKEAITYGQTGVSKLVTDNINNLRDELAAVDAKFINGEYGGSMAKDGKHKFDSAIKKANQAKTKIIKMAHYKVLNDAANRHIFPGTGGPSTILRDYNKRVGRSGQAKPYWVKSNYDDFLKTGARGNIERAEYIVSRHKVGHANLPGAQHINNLLDRIGLGKHKLKGKALSAKTPNLKFLKWTDNNMSGVLRGAQFNYKTYELLEAVSKEARKGVFRGAKHGTTAFEGAFNSFMQNSGKGGAVHNVKWIRNNKGQRVILFNFSPVMKGNFDWGGYNVVAEYNPKKPSKIRFIGTDLRDTPISSTFKGNHVLNYVESKDFKIKEMIDETDMNAKPKLKSAKPTEVKKRAIKKQKAKLPENIEIRRQLIESGDVNLGSQQKGVVQDLEKIATRRQRIKKKVRFKGTSKTMRKNMLKYAKYAAGAGPIGLMAAGGIGLLAWAMGKGAYDFGYDLLSSDE